MILLRRKNAAQQLLPTLLKRPDAFSGLSLDEWDLVIRQARKAGILARLCFLLDDLGNRADVPERPRSHLEAARTLALKHARDVRWEVSCVCRILAETGVTITLLKGAAYLMAELPPARGRLFADVDFMVPRERIGEVERVLTANGWGTSVEDSYDQRYYRRWTHQIPPLQHLKRGTVLDVHHTIAPPTARSPVPAEALAAESLPLESGSQLRILAPADMVLHSAVHLFNEGEFDRGLRDLLDLSDLLQHFGLQPGFWEKLAARAEALGLTGPLFMAFRYLDCILGAPLPPPAREFALRWQPAGTKLACFDALFLRALLPDHHSCDDLLTSTARWLLYVRAHYLRMPLHLLLPHLLRKALYRPEKTDNDARLRPVRQRVEELLRLTPPPNGKARGPESAEGPP